MCTDGRGMVQGGRKIAITNPLRVVWHMPEACTPDLKPTRPSASKALGPRTYLHQPTRGLVMPDALNPYL